MKFKNILLLTLLACSTASKPSKNPLKMTSELKVYGYSGANRLSNSIVTLAQEEPITSETDFFHKLSLIEFRKLLIEELELRAASLESKEHAQNIRNKLVDLKTMFAEIDASQKKTNDFDLSKLHPMMKKLLEVVLDGAVKQGAEQSKNETIHMVLLALKPGSECDNNELAFKKALAELAEDIMQQLKNKSERTTISTYSTALKNNLNNIWIPKIKDNPFLVLFVRHFN